MTITSSIINPITKSIVFGNWWESGDFAGKDFIVDAVGNRAYINSVSYSSINDSIASSSATFTRSSTGTDENLAGDYSSFAINTIRRTDKKTLLIEQASIGHSQFNLSGAGGTNSWNAVVVATGLPDPFGTNTAVRFSFAPYKMIRIPCSGLQAGIDYFASGFVKIISNSGINNVRIDLSDGSDEYIMSQFGAVGDWARFKTGALQTLPSVGQFVDIMSWDGTGDLVLDICGVQVEEVKTTSPIIGAFIPMSRAADVLTIFPSPATYDVTVTFDDDSIQVLAGQVIGAGGWTAPTNLNRPNIKTITGVKL